MNNVKSKTAVREATDTEAAALRKSHPMPPPGVSSFDIRRFRRRERKSMMLKVNRELSNRLSQAEEAQRSMAKRFAEEGRKRVNPILSFVRRVFSSRNKG